AINDPSQCIAAEVCTEEILLGGNSSGSGGAGGTGPGGGAGGLSGAGGIGGVGSASGGSAGAGGSAPCPTGMIGVTASSGTSYCVDSFETTRAEYQQFLALTNNGADVIAMQPAYCAWNTTFVPDATCEGYACSGSCDDHPQVCIDWCDSYMYCAWAGKRMCG